MKKKKIFVQTAIACGGNLGNEAEIFAEAAAGLAFAGLRRVRLSPLYRNPARDCAPGTPDFTNAVIVGDWSGSAPELLARMQALEVAAGRPADHGVNCSRTLDLDLIWFGGQTLRTPELTVPHPRARERDFVTVPLAAVAPEILRALLDAR